MRSKRSGKTTRTVSLPLVRPSRLTDAFALAHQAHFEVACFSRAAERYREAAASRDLVALSPGKRLLREVVPPLTARIAAAQSDAVDLLRAPGRQPEWSWPIQLVPPERAAVIVVSTALRAAVVAPTTDGGQSADRHASITSVARMLVTAYRTQIEYDRWAGDEPDLEKRLLKRFPDVDRRCWVKWRARVNATRCEPWEEGVGVSLGAHLIHLLCVASPTRFSVETHRLVGGRTQAYLRPSEETLALIDDVTARAEVASPLLRPMTCCPVPWRYE